MRLNKNFDEYICPVSITTKNLLSVLTIPPVVDHTLLTLKVAFIHRDLRETPDVARFVEEKVLKEAPSIDYSRLPLELNPNYAEIRKRERLRKRKERKLAADQLSNIKSRTKEKIASVGNAGEFEEAELNEIRELEKEEEPETLDTVDSDSGSDMMGDYGGTKAKF